MAESPDLPRRGLFDRDWQKALIVMLTLLVGVALVWVLWQVISPLLHTIILFALGAVLAFALAAPVDGLTRAIGNRAAAIAIVYLLAATMVIGGLALLAGPFAGQAAALVSDLPRYATELQTRLPEAQGFLAGYGIQADVDQVKAGATSAIQQGGTEVLGRLVGTLAEVGGLLLDAVLVLVISVYLVADGTRLRERSLAIVPAGYRERALFLQANLARVLGGYLRGQLTLATIVGLLTGLGMSMLGLPYAIVLGVLAGLFELIPMFGPILSAVPAVIVALFLPFPTVIWVLLFFLAVQQLENNVLAPRISGHAVGLHPLGAMFALLAGFQLAGILGGLFAVPIAGVVWVLLGAAYRNAVVEPTPPPRWALPRWRRPAAPAVGPPWVPAAAPQATRTRGWQRVRSIARRQRDAANN
ncbi:MAG: AI-2E family transporter [Chloroflexi bacterium]|nr:AI-2E family transporter [Chloroflexota bacterium]